MDLGRLAAKQTKLTDAEDIAGLGWQWARQSGIRAHPAADRQDTPGLPGQALIEGVAGPAGRGAPGQAPSGRYLACRYAASASISPSVSGVTIACMATAAGRSIERNTLSCLTR
jgi:hypothetical protein